MSAIPACEGCGKALELTPDDRCRSCGYELPQFQGNGGQKFDSFPIEVSVNETNSPTTAPPQRYVLLEELSEGASEPSWLWGGFVAKEALTVIAGRPKVGKSTLLFALLAAIRWGRPFLRHETERAGAVLLTEERPQTVLMKARALGLANSIRSEPIPIGKESNLSPAVYVVGRHQANGIPWPQMVEETTAFAIGHGLGVMVVDTWNAWANLGGEDENAAGAVLKAVNPLGEAAAAGLAVLLIAHQRKAGGEFGEGIWGSSALAGAVDVVVELERLKGDQNRSARIVRSVSRFPSTPDELYFEFTEEGSFDLFDPEEASAAADRSRVLEELRLLGPATADSVADAAGISKSRTRKALEELVGVGVEKTGKGVKGDPHIFEAAA